MEWLREVDGAARSPAELPAAWAVAGVVVSVSPAIVGGISGILGFVSGAGSAARAHNLKNMSGAVGVLEFGALKFSFCLSFCAQACILSMACILNLCANRGD